MGQSTSKNMLVFEPRIECPQPISHHEEPLLASVLGEINPQSRSPLYTLLPAEVREMIFRLSITESLECELPKISSAQKSAPAVPRHNTSYPQPRQKLTTNNSLALLLTCRWIYLETYHLPIQVKEHIFYRPSLTGPPGSRNLSIKKYLQRFKPQQLQFLTSIHIFTHQLFLEDGSFAALCRLGLLQGLQKLKLTIRYRDWWEWERSSKMELSPWGRGFVSYTSDEKKRVHFASLKEHAWGYALQYLKGLKELELQLESSEDRVEELERVVWQAQAWEFPMSDDRVLMMSTSPVQWSCWDSVDCRWSNVCGRCFGQGEDCEDCLRRQIRRDSGLGPIILTALLKWQIGSART